MANRNSNLHQAKKAKCDEFYTQYADIESELKHYTPQFEGKTVYCNCDNPDCSNFTKYFKDNFDTLKLKRLISTGYNANGRGKALDYNGYGETTELQGNGDFRSEECIELLKQADIVVTNPPFSLFREYVAQLVQYNKKFLIIGNMNAVTYKEIFPLIKYGLLWLGANGIKDMSFKVPSTYGERETRFWVDENGQHWRSLGNVCWFTNMEPNKPNYPKCLIKSYNESEYPLYDNYNAINVDKVKDIPYDYDGVIGVPITILNDLYSDGLIHFEAPMRERMCTKSSESQTQQDGLEKCNVSQSSTDGKCTTESSFNVYKIVGVANNGSGSEYDLFKPTINQNIKFKRILIQRV